jgi:hypothetical protein
MAYVVDKLSRNLFNLRDDNEAKITFIHFREVSLVLRVCEMQRSKIVAVTAVHFPAMEDPSSTQKLFFG